MTVLAPLGTVIGLGSRRRRLRTEIRENLELLRELQTDAVLRDHTPAAAWLQGRVAIDIAKLAGHELGTPKKPIPWGSLIVALLLSAGFALWTHLLTRDGFVWYSVFPAGAALLMIVSVVGMLTNRELPPEEAGALPDGAIPIKLSDPAQRLATGVGLAASGTDDLDDRFSPDGQVGVVLRFLRALREGDYEAALELADARWQLCRIQAWLWNNREALEIELDQLDAVAESLHLQREPRALWAEFVAVEARQFADALVDADPDELGVASRRRRVGPHHDLVILTPLGTSGGYFVTGPTPLPNAWTFVVHNLEGRWRVANHVGSAAPEPGWPPTWWTTDDPAVES